MIYNSLYSGEEIDEAVGAFQNLKGMLSGVIEILYPIGCIYTSTQPTNPADLFGGTWIQIKDTFLLTAGDTYNAGEIGGAITHSHTNAPHSHTTAGHVLTADEMPKHYHTSMHWSTPTGNRFGVNSTDGGGAWRFTYSAAASEDNFVTGYAGSSASHSHGDTGMTAQSNTSVASNLPPYKVVYAWERIS